MKHTVVKQRRVLGVIDDMIDSEYKTCRSAYSDSNWSIEHMPEELDDNQIRAIHLIVATRMRTAMGESLLWWEIEQAVSDYIQMMEFDHKYKKGEGDEDQAGED